MKIRLTQEGLGLLLGQAMILFAAWNTGANLVYLIFAVTVGCYAASLALALRRRPPLAGHLQIPQEVHEGTPFPYRIIVENPSPRPLHFCRIAPRFEPAAEGAPLKRLTIEPGARCELAGTASLPVRGAYQAREVGVQSLYPAGLLALDLSVPSHGEVVALPAPLAHPLPAIPGLAQPSSRTETGSPSKGDGEAFYGLREYRPGDPIRKIHWKVTARAGRTMAREDEEDRTNRYYVFLDLRETKQTGQGRHSSLEVSIRVGAALSLQLLKLNCPVRVYLLDPQAPVSPPSFSARDIPHVLRFLGRLRYSREGDFVTGVRRVLPQVPPGSYLLFVLTDLDAEVLALMESLSGSGCPVLGFLNLPDVASIHAARREPRLERMIRHGMTFLFFDRAQERVVSA